MATRRLLCTFTLDNLLCGIDVERVQEVLRYREMTDVPLAPPEVSGLINLRGQIVTAVDLRCRLGLAPLCDGRLPMNIVARTGDGMVSFLVDEILDVLDVTETEFEPAPEPLGDLLKSLVLGVYKLDKRLLLLLDTDRLLDIDCAAEA
jgi:purine-binding chemotaxis protein CheW